MDYLVKPRSSHHKNSRIFDTIYSREEFSEVVQRERLRTHRNMAPFSLLIFGTSADSGQHRILETLVKILRPRVRATDEIGWYNDRQIGLLLPDTRDDGARILAKDVLEKMGESSQLFYEIQSYPGSKPEVTLQSEDTVSKDGVAENGSEDEKNAHGIEHSEIEEIFAPPMPAWKRGLDILGAGLGLVVLSPVFLFIAVLIKIVSPGPVLFKQVRVGFRKKPFVCLKFRTMKVEADNSVHKTYLKELIQNENQSMKKLDNADPRIIPFGKILRKSGLDELPQLINILLGDMSLVGPRPCTVYEASEYRIWQHRRFDTKPGLTGLWQVSGKNTTSFVEMMRFDIGYAIRKSFLKDIWIIIRTVPAVLSQVFDRLPKKKKEICYAESGKHRRDWLRILGSKSNSKF